MIIAGLGAENAFADAEAGQGYFTGMASYIDDDKDRGVNDGIYGGQIGIGYAVSDALNIEGMISAAAHSGDPDQEHIGIGIDLQRVFRRAEKFSPYLFGGIGYFMVDPAGAVDRDDGAMYAAGAGFYLDLGESNVALRGEYRLRMDSATDDNLYDNLVSVGLHIPFGASTPKWVDSDRDGVADPNDRCPNTPAGAQVDAYGCELDSDGDGVKDSMDECPGTPAGVTVDEKGCPVDSDGDGVTDDKDECPNTPAGTEVDEKGCELDSDGDGVPDRLDEGPGTPPNTPVDRKGCEIKGDYVLEGVNFQTNSDQLTAGSTAVLDQVLETIKKYPEIKFVVEGHTDSDGSAEYNESLSTRRAQTVYDYFANAGVDESRMSARGYGESRPIADNTTAAGKAQNRRVALSVVED